MEYNKLQFKVSSELKNIIGKDLITDDFSAIFELVKNSFDAHATYVEICFDDIKKNGVGSITITDNGKGMNYEDIINKWLFVAYSAKKDGTEDNDYRYKIKGKRYYAGAKGIGRFSCDKLGKKLLLVSTKDERNSTTEEVLIDWELFEQDAKENFIDINVKHRTLDRNPLLYDKGTVLKIYELRDDPPWTRQKILKLKSALAKLINPFESTNERKFKIVINAPEFLEEDKHQKSAKDKVNGVVKNNILDILKLKTTKIVSRISSDSQHIITELSNNGEWIYRIEEINTSYPLLHEILIELYFLNRKSKNNFTRLMGLRPTEYGSVFLYKNGIRIYPFGEPGEDTLSLDARRAKRMGNYVGTNDLIGRIEISGENTEFQEASSRGSGLIQNSSYKELKDFFIEKVITKLESFRRHIVKYGIELDDVNESDNEEILKIVKLISDLNGQDENVRVQFNENIIDILDNTQRSNENAMMTLKNIERIAERTDNEKLFSEIKKIEIKLKDAVKEAGESSRRILEMEREVSEKETQNLFLKSIKSQEFEELVSLMHHIGISSGIINKKIKILTYKLEKKIKISNDELSKSLADINFENQKILSISRFATKANFKVNAEKQRLDLVMFIKEYIENVAKIYLDKIIISINNPEIEFITTFRPLEMIILLDNLISNSKKADSEKINITLKISNEVLFIEFQDDGIGISDKSTNRIFDFGYTTTGGSGLGLNHVSEILEKIGGSVSLDKEFSKGAKFTIKIYK